MTSKLTITYISAYADLNAIETHLSAVDKSNFDISIVKGKMYHYDKKFDAVQLTMTGDLVRINTTLGELVNRFDLPCFVAKPFRMNSLPKFIREIISYYESSPSTKDAYTHLADIIKEKKMHYTSLSGGMLELGYLF